MRSTMRETATRGKLGEDGAEVVQEELRRALEWFDLNFDCAAREVRAQQSRAPSMCVVARPGQSPRLSRRTLSGGCST